MNKIKGFVYADQHKQVEMTREEWRAKLLGLNRRVENGETFGCQPNGGKVVFEVYGIIPAPKMVMPS